MSKKTETKIACKRCGYSLEKLLNRAKEGVVECPACHMVWEIIHTKDPDDKTKGAGVTLRPYEAGARETEDGGRISKSDKKSQGPEWLKDCTIENDGELKKYNGKEKDLVLPDKMTRIGDGAFSGHKGLTSVTMPNSVTSIGVNAFYYCTGLTSITIPNSVTSIGEGAFGACKGLKSIEIPSSVTHIGRCAFAECSSLTSILVDPDNKKYRAEGNCLIEKATNTVIAGCKTSVIPNGVTSIGENAFWYCTGLTSITIPSGVKSIGYAAFTGCTDLKTVVIPDSVTQIGGYAFEG